MTQAEARRQLLARRDGRKPSLRRRESPKAQLARHAKRITDGIPAVGAQEALYRALNPDWREDLIHEIARQAR